MALAEYRDQGGPEGLPKLIPSISMGKPHNATGTIVYADDADYNRVVDAVALLADEMNQLCMAIEVYARDGERARHLFEAARRTREKIVELIPS